MRLAGSRTVATRVCALTLSLACGGREQKAVELPQTPAPAPAVVPAPAPAPKEIPIQTAMRDWASTLDGALEPMKPAIERMEAGSSAREDCNALIVAVKNALLVAKWSPDSDLGTTTTSMLSALDEAGKSCLRSELQARDVLIVAGRSGAKLLNQLLMERYHLEAAVWLVQPEHSRAAERAIALAAKEKADREAKERREMERLEAASAEQARVAMIEKTRFDAAVDAHYLCNHLRFPDLGNCRGEIADCDSTMSSQDPELLICYKAVKEKYKGLVKR